MRRKYSLAIAKLELESPVWWRLIDLDELDMAHPEHCVFGQVYNRLYHEREDDGSGCTSGFYRFHRRHGLNHTALAEMGVEEDHNSRIDGCDQNDKMQAYWERKIRALQAADPAFQAARR